RNPRGLNVLLVRLEDWERNEAATNGHAARNSSDLIERAVRELISALRSAAGRSAVPYLVCICPSARAMAHEPHRADFFQHKEQELAAELAVLANVNVVTPGQLFALYPVPDHYDPRGDELGHVPYTPEYFTALATMIARTLHLQRRSAPKVIVLDCDQTLWAGVCGEDGPDGIELRAPHRALQEFMRAQLDAGRLLCLCSKNSPEDVQAVFERHPEWPLKLEHFTANRINWLPKSGNLKALAQELNLGIESFVLVDDNPVECAEVQANCPGALALQLPEDPEQFPEFLKHAWIFDHQTVTAEDLKRTDFYRQERERVQAHTEALSMSEFVTQLDLKVVIAELSPDELTRAAQLTQRTNQFNCTTRRRTETEIQGLPDQSKTLVVSVSDRFGDYGLVGLVIFGFEKDALAVETFLLSCRALGRGVEHQILANLGKVAKAQGAAHVDVHFVSSAKNKPALDFLETVGGPFRQALNGGYVFRFPTEVAAGVAFEPHNITVDALALVPAGESTSQLDARPTFARWRWIALEASAVNQIQALIEAKAGVRSSSPSTSAAPNTQVERELCHIWQELLRVERVGLRDDFFALGGHSLLAVRLFAQIEQRLHVKLPIVTIFQSPTVEQLVRAMDQQAAQAPVDGLRPIQANGSRPPLYLVHGAGGDVLWGYANLAQYSDPDQPIYGIQSGNGEEFKTLEDMATHYLSAVRAFQPIGPYQLGGYCFGGNVAQEMARQLEALGESVAVLALLDCSASNGSYERFDWRRPAAYFEFTRNVTYWLDDFRQLKAAQRRSLVVRKLRTLPRKLWSRISRTQAPTDFDLEEFIDVTHVSEQETRLWNNHLGLLVRHVSKPYRGSITLLRTRSHPLVCSFEDDLGWGKLASNITIKRIPGSHEGIFVEPHVRCLARELEESLRPSPQRSRPVMPAPNLV
ncbi:MAG: HAD-IIIC family phosphatase, partial [Akkermansiaceae bacterium]|nr:HAD-IIIC family phosphatase [Verrucomicrobiales bacterium]